MSSIFFFFRSGADDARLAAVLPELLPEVLQYLDHSETRSGYFEVREKGH